MADQGDDKIRVQQATDVVDLIGQHVALKPQGREFVALCPFHDDSRPSMQVSPQKQIYKCFACGSGGDVFSFMMQYHRMTFIEALQHLADRAGIELTPRGQAGDAGQTRSTRQRVSEANHQALKFYRKLLLDSEHGRAVRDYLAERGISDEMIEQFQLGYAPDRWDGLAQAVQQKGWAIDDFEQAGLVQPRKQGRGHIDRLRHRLIFPICDTLGRPIAFGGRRLREEDEPKYLNSPETELFHKSATLYGLDVAKKAIIDSGTAVVVEGYTDVIACHQAGACHVIATLGTALTMDHVKHLRRYADRVVLIFDPDEAGQRAADRAVEVFLSGEVDVALATLPGGKDPADLLAEADGAERWHQAVNEAEDALQHQFHRVGEQLSEAETITARQRIAQQYIDKLARLGLGRGTPSLRRSFVIQRLAELLRMNEQQVNELLSQSAQRGPANPTSQTESAATGTDERDSDGDLAPPRTRREQAMRLAERQLIGGLLKDNELFHKPLHDGISVDEAVLPEELSESTHRQLYQQIHDYLAEGEAVSLAGLLAELAAHERHDQIQAATEADRAIDAAAGDEPQRVAEVALLAAQALRDQRHKQEYEQVKQSLVDQGGEPDQSRQAQLLRDLVEHNRANPSPARIARPRE
jgi:DNA primase